MRVRRFLRPFHFGSRVTIGAGVRVNLIRYNGLDAGTLIFDGLHFVRGTTSNVATRFITDCEALLELNQDFGACEGGLRVPMFSEAPAGRPFFVDAEDVGGGSLPLAWFLLGYIAGELMEDDGFFEPRRNARPFVESSVRGGVSCAQNVPTRILSFTAPDTEHGTRALRIDITGTGSSGDTVSLSGPGLDSYKQLPILAINSFAGTAWLPIIGRLEPRRDYAVEMTRANIGSGNYGAALHGWSW